MKTNKATESPTRQVSARIMRRGAGVLDAGLRNMARPARAKAATMATRARARIHFMRPDYGRAILAGTAR